MEVRLSDRIRAVEPSATLSLDALVKELRRQGRDVISFGTGEPDFDTPGHIKAAAIEAIGAGFTKYTASGGIPELKAAICGRLAKDRGLTYEPGEIIVSNGAKHVLYNLFQVLLNPGDEVLIPAPYWVSYVEQVRLAGGIPALVPTDPATGFEVDPAAIQARITSRTRALLINSPSNPTGEILDEDVLGRIGAIAQAHGLVVVSDEIYSRLTYDGSAAPSIVAVVPELRPQTVVIDGVSKSYSMTGWRIGYAAAPRDLIKAMEDLQSHSTSNPNSIAQKAALAALDGPDDAVTAMRRSFEARRDLMVKLINEIPGVACRTPRGAFYVFPNVSGLIGRSWQGRAITDSTALSRLFLEEAGVGVVPGAAFGQEGFLRLSYATSEDKIEEGLSRITAVAARME